LIIKPILYLAFPVGLCIERLVQLQMHGILKDLLQRSNNDGEDGYAEGDIEGDDDMLAINANYLYHWCLMHRTRRGVHRRDDTDSMVHISIINKSIGS
jgi:hypothetical protein